MSGTSDSGIGVRGIGLSGGVFGQTASATAVFGIATGPAGLAGAFLGGAFVSGHLQVGGGLDVIGTKNFKIDHPSDPENKYLVHTCVESSEMKNVYDGAARLDEEGSAWVDLPEWFEALNGDFRYQLTAVGGPRARVARCRGDLREALQDRRRRSWNEGLLAGGGLARGPMGRSQSLRSGIGEGGR